jgi:hypothetical protein
MICRFWRGWTSHQNAGAYEALLRGQILPGIAARHVCKRIELLRREVPEGAEFVTLLWFASLDDVRKFAGENYEIAVVPPEARALLARFDERSLHYETVLELE